MKGHTFGYYIMLVGLGIAVLNVFVTNWPLWVSFAGFGVMLLGMVIGEIEIGIRIKNRKDKS